MHQSGKVQAVKPETGLDPSAEERRLIKGLDQTNGVPRAGNNVNTCRRDREQTGQAPQFASQIRGWQGTAAHKDQAQLTAFPEQYRHESEGLLLLKFNRETLLAGYLLGNVFHCSVEVMLENDLNKKQQI